MLPLIDSYKKANPYSADERNATQRSSTGVTEAGIKKIF